MQCVKIGVAGGNVGAIGCHSACCTSVVHSSSATIIWLKTSSVIFGNSRTRDRIYLIRGYGPFFIAEEKYAVLYELSALLSDIALKKTK
jgi:hypothetical protein